MSKRSQILAFSFVLLIVISVTLLGKNSSLPSGSVPFAKATVNFEQNATDGDVEVVFEVKGSDEGLKSLKIVSPKGKAIVDFNGSDEPSIGIRQFRFETPEPENAAAIEAAYPEGVYIFTGETVSGQKLEATANLSHKLPVTSTFLFPQKTSKKVPSKGLEISWADVKNIEGYILYIEQDSQKVSLTVNLPGSSKSFKVPDNFLAPDTKYQLGLGSVLKGGNTSFIETYFTTSPEE